VRGTEAHVVFTGAQPPRRRRRRLRRAAARDVVGRSRSAQSLGDRWSFSFQSESPTGVPWLGPGHPRSSPCPARGGCAATCSLARRLRRRPPRDQVGPRRRGRRGSRRELGLEFERIEMPNADPRFVGVLAGLVRRVLSVPSRA
jgi:hypothetical protein